MKIIRFTLLTFSLLAMIRCGYSPGKSEIKKDQKDNYKKCLEEFFSNLPLENCLSFATSPSEKRMIEVKETAKGIEVYVEIAECLKDFKMYHSWIAAELQASCMENKAVSYSFLNGNGSEVYFSLQKDSIPIFEERGNISLYIDKSVPKPLATQAESFLFNSQMSSEKSYFVYMQNDELQICCIHYIEWGDQEASKEAVAFLYELKKQFEDSKIFYNVKFHALEHYGRTIFSI